MKTKLLLIDDDVKILSMLRRALSYEGYEVNTAVNGKEALALIRSLQPDLVLLDVMMPELDGFEVLKALRAEQNYTPVLLLTAKDAVSDRVAGLDYGADDYLVKPFALEELLARIRVLLRRGLKQETAEKLQVGDISLASEQRQAYRGDRDLRLAGKEFDLLQAFLANPGIVLSRDVLMEKVWGYDYEGESNVLEVYIANLRQKLESEGEARAIHTVRGVGYVLRNN